MQDVWCRREVLAPLQQAEAIDIRRKSDAFGEKVEDFRKFFQQKAPFSVPGGELKLEHVSRSTSHLQTELPKPCWTETPAVAFHKCDPSVDIVFAYTNWFEFTTCLAHTHWSL